MANLLKGEVEFTNGMIMVLNMNALCEIEAETGKDHKELFDVVTQNRQNATAYRMLAYCGLKKYQPEITLFEAGDLADENSEAIVTAVLYAMGITPDEIAKLVEEAQTGNLPAAKPKTARAKKV